MSRSASSQRDVVDGPSDSLADHEMATANSLARSPSRVKRLSSAIDNAVDKLGRSLNHKSSPPHTPSSPSSSSHKRIFSLSRRTKASDSADGYEVSSDLHASAPSLSSPSKVPVQSADRRASLSDDSPFINPESPSLVPVRPSLANFRGDGSIRQGTQALIQVLQALPWTPDADEHDHEEQMNLAQSPTTIDSDDDSDEERAVQHLASSIHAIYRPLARSKQVGTSGIRPQDISEEQTIEGGRMFSEDELEVDDFEEETPRVPSPSMNSVGKSALQLSVGVGSRADLKRARSGSVNTVRVKRRARLAEKLKEVFELSSIEEVQAEMPCWLLRSVLLQGYMYLTNSHLCFFAHMPSREDQVLKSGSLNKKAQRTKRWIKHWFVLKNDALSWYQSSSDPYFPHGIVDLKYTISCEPHGEKGFRLKTNQKSLSFSADSVPSRDEWVKAIRKVMFKTQNNGDSVKIAIPYSSIIDIEKSSAMDFSETIEVKVLDKNSSFAMDSYFFAYFHDLPSALDQIRDAVRTHRSAGEEAILDRALEVLDTTTASRSNNQPYEIERQVSSETGRLSSVTSGFRLPSILRPFHTSTIETHDTVDSTEGFTHITKRQNSASFVPVCASPEPTIGTTVPDTVPNHTYPPSTEHTQLSSRDSYVSGISGGIANVSNWVKNSRARSLFGSSESSGSVLGAVPGVKEIYSSSSSRWSGATGDMFSILESPDMTIDDDVVEKFRSAFAYDEREKLLGYFTGYIFRLLPVHGKLYVSSNHFCFKSSGPLTSRTKMTLPIRDILGTEKTKATRFGHHGLIVIVKGHEELFFEFTAEDRRDAFVRLLERQADDVRQRLLTGEVPEPTQGKHDALILEEFEAPHDDHPPNVVESLAESLPAVMFTSASSTFLTFKPSKSLRVTCLTIGSRGDVQPYIALAKGLMADGHQVKIATHKEFKEWIESYGIEFSDVGGDPAELMRICVENGVFTMSFLREGIQKFRGWLDDLLLAAWEACQGSDVLIESPSAMAGYHIAEALGIPYFRAFTMTWTRTRAYPHAFAVPEHKMGGGYNYMSYVIFDQVFWRAISGQVNRWRRNVLHLNSTSLDKMEPHKIPFLYNFSPAIVPPPLDWPEWIRVTGYWFLEDADVSAKKWTPPLDLVQFIDSAHAKGKKVVYIGFGSIVVSDPKAMTRSVVEAVVQSGVYAILSKGWSDRLHTKATEAAESEEPLPSQIYPISSVPHDWLFSRIDAACHHGGAGTTGASLRAGIPTIIRPFFGDQFFWADRVEALGVGTGVRRLTVDTLKDALTIATTDRKQIDRARMVGEQIRREDGVSIAIESLYRDLEYARSLIKNRTVHPDDASDEEHGTIKDGPLSGYSSSGSARGALSEDWSVISEQDDRTSSSSSRQSTSVERSGKRSSLAAAVLSVLPESLSALSPKASSNAAP